jgi:putative PIN family toxin of toxin-antitoxin system
VLGLARFGSLRIDISDAILDELVTVLRDDFGWEEYRLHFAKAELANITNRVIPTRKIDFIKDDPDDNIVLDCAVAGGSDCIISDDKDLLRLKEFEGIRIQRPSDYLKAALSR